MKSLKNNNNIKKAWILMFLCAYGLKALACEACKKQQPKILQDITHGAGPESNWDYLIVAVMVVVTLYVLVATLKCLVKPSEQNDGHIKRMILNH